MTGKGSSIKAVILDWAGVTVDYGSRAPAQVFVEVFHRHGIEISFAEARGPMGKAKRDHIVEIASLPRVRSLWQTIHGGEIEESDLQQMYDEFLPLQLETLARDTTVIPGVSAAVSELRQRGIQIGSTTGYTRQLMDVVVPLARAGGYSPDVVICADDVPSGRPAPWMNFLAAQKMNVFPFSSIVVVDDTKVGIEAGRNAGAITVGVSRTGNSLGLSEDEANSIPVAELGLRLQSIENEFRTAGAHYVIESVAQLPELISGISVG